MCLWLTLAAQRVKMRLRITVFLCNAQHDTSFDFNSAELTQCGPQLVVSSGMFSNILQNRRVCSVFDSPRTFCCHSLYLISQSTWKQNLAQSYDSASLCPNDWLILRFLCLQLQWKKMSHSDHADPSSWLLCTTNGAILPNLFMMGVNKKWSF